MRNGETTSESSAEKYCETYTSNRALILKQHFFKYDFGLWNSFGSYTQLRETSLWQWNIHNEWVFIGLGFTAQSTH